MAIGLAIGRTIEDIKVKVILHDEKKEYEFLIQKGSSSQDILYIIQRVTETIYYDDEKEYTYFVNEFKHDNFIDFTNGLIKVYNDVSIDEQ